MFSSFMMDAAGCSNRPFTRETRDNVTKQPPPPSQDSSDGLTRHTRTHHHEHTKRQNKENSTLANVTTEADVFPLFSITLTCFLWRFGKGKEKKNVDIVDLLYHVVSLSYRPFSIKRARYARRVGK